MKSESEIIEFLEANIKLTRDEVADLLLEFDNQKWAREYMKSASGCALYAGAYLRWLGMTDKELITPYAKQIGRAVSNIVTIGRRHNAWETGKDLLSFPEIGDIIMIGQNGNEHILVVCGVSNDSLVISSDSGQATSNTMARRERMMVTYNNLTYLVDPAKPWNGTIPAGRVISGKLNIKKLPL